MSHALTRKDIKTLSLSSLGGALEFYDFIVFLTFIPVLKTQFFPLDSNLGAIISIYGIYAIAYFVRPLSGVVIAHFGDIFGRKKMFMLSLFLMALPTLCIGLLPTFQSVGYLAPILLLLMRLLQGIALGGEVPSAHVFVTEHVPSSRMGIANSLIAAGLTLGVLIGYAVSTLLNLLFSQEEITQYAWRFPFILGGLLGFIAIYLRQYLSETPVFLKFKTQKETSQKYPIQRVLGEFRKETVLAVLSTWLLMTGVIMVLLTPNLMKSVFNLSAPFVDKIALWATGMNIIGSVVAGLLVDKIGLKRTLLAYSILLAIGGSALFMLLPQLSQSVLSILYLVSSLFLGIVACVPIIIVKLYPADVRLSGMGFSYNIGNALFGGLTTFLVPVFAQQFGVMFIAFYLLFLCMLGILISVNHRLES